MKELGAHRLPGDRLSSMRKSLRKKALPALCAAIAVLLPTIVMAWEPNLTSAPYTGTQDINSSYTYVVQASENMRWSTYGLVSWRGTGPGWVDVSVKCSNGVDELDGRSYATNMPNFGWEAKDDCGSESYKEETELAPDPFSMNAEQDYYYNAHFQKIAGSADGDIDVTWQQWDSMYGYMYWDWLEVDAYSY